MTDLATFSCPRCLVDIGAPPAAIVGHHCPNHRDARGRPRWTRFHIEEPDEAVPAPSPTPRPSRNQPVALGATLAGSPSRLRPRRGVGRQAGQVGSP